MFLEHILVFLYTEVDPEFDFWTLQGCVSKDNNPTESPPFTFYRNWVRHKTVVYLYRELQAIYSAHMQLTKLMDAVQFHVSKTDGIWHTTVKELNESLFSLGTDACWSQVCAFLSGLLSDQTTLRFIPRLMSQNYSRNWNHTSVQKAEYKTLGVMKGSGCVMPKIHHFYGCVK